MGHRHPASCEASPEEIDYLCRAANRYFARTIKPADVLWHYAGIRPLFDDGAKNVSKVTRDYTLRIDDDTGKAPVLSVFGGKITTYRRLAEHALEKLAPWFPDMRPAWTANAYLPGGDLRALSLRDYTRALHDERPGFPLQYLAALTARHGSAVREVLGDAAELSQCGEHFGADLYAREVDYGLRCEWALTADDILWRRTKTGLFANAEQKQALVTYISKHFNPAVR